MAAKRVWDGIKVGVRLALRAVGALVAAAVFAVACLLGAAEWGASFEVMAVLAGLGGVAGGVIGWCSFEHAMDVLWHWN